jgi:site-specific DNA recombinase
MRAALYARFSTEEQNEDSIRDQFRVCERIAQANGFEIVARFEDRAISGGTAERPGYQSLLASARRKDVAIVVAEDVSRLWRNRATYGQDSAELEDLGVHLITAVGDDTRRDGWGLVLGIKQAMAEAARREVSYRTKRGMEGLALAGQSTGGRCYGFRGAAVDPREAAVVLLVYQRRSQGLSCGRIASELEAAGVPNAWGEPQWSRFTVRTLLANPRYRGAVVYGRTEIRVGARDSRRRRRVIRSEPIVNRYDEACRLVSDVLWYACNPSSRIQEP